MVLFNEEELQNGSEIDRCSASVPVDGNRQYSDSIRVAVWTPLMASVLLMLPFVFVLGMFLGHRKAFPFGCLLRLKHRLLFLWFGAEQAKGREPQFVVEIDSPEALAEKRLALARFIWGNAGLPLQRLPAVDSASATDPLVKRFHSRARATRLTVGMAHGIDSHALLLTPRGRIREVAAVYQQGHEGSAWAGRRVIGQLLDKGYRVVILEMPLLGGNSQPVIHLRRHGPVRLVDHDYFYLLDHEFGGNALRYFIEPVIACLNLLAARGVQEFAMLGWSGGGWTTTMCAALDPRIRCSFSVAGSLPFNLRRRGELSDYENHLPGLYEVANYPELYVLSAHGEGRRAVQILNEFDPVVWAGRRGKLYEACVQETLSRLGSGHFESLIDSSWVGHGISSYAMKFIISQLDEMKNPWHQV